MQYRISTCYPSTTSFDLALGPDLPERIGFTLEALDIRPGGFPPPSRYTFRHSLFLKSTAPYRLLLRLFKNAPLPMYNYIPKLRCCVLAPDIFGAGISRLVSYYALFECVAASEPTS